MNPGTIRVAAHPLHASTVLSKIKFALPLTVALATLLCAPRFATAQCYTFHGGSNVSVTFRITNLPTPTVSSTAGTVSYKYFLSGLAGNTATVKTNGYVYSWSAPDQFTIETSSSSVTSQFLIVFSSNSPPIEAILGGESATPNVFQKGLPAAIPSNAQWTGDIELGLAGPGGGTASLTGITSACGSDATNNKRSDFYGDGKADYAIWRPSNGGWFVLPSVGSSASASGQRSVSTEAANTPISQQWGLPGDLTVPEDYDGDGKTDFAVWRPAVGTWYVIPSGNPGAPLVDAWGENGDIPLPGDYDGDGKADYAVWRPSNGTWYVLLSGTPSVPVVQQWGLNGDIPVPGDYDGDGKTDYAVWRPSNGTWYVILSGSPSVPVAQQWGLNGDVPLPGDYDGDGKTDYAVWRPTNGNWYVILSSNPTKPVLQQWGLEGDTPVPADYDGDGKTDYTVWRASSGTWFVISSGNPSTPIAQQWGQAGDLPQ